MQAPAPRPAQGRGTFNAAKWIVSSAVVIAMIYGLRTITDAGRDQPAATSKVKALMGAGPPPPIGTWLVAYGASFFMLSVIAIGAPELAASLAMIMLIGTVLTNGVEVASDLGGLEGSAAGSAKATSATASTAAVTGPTASTLTSQGIARGGLR